MSDRKYICTNCGKYKSHNEFLTCDDCAKEQLEIDRLVDIGRKTENGVLVVEHSVYSQGLGDYMDYFVCGSCGFAVSQHFEPEYKYCAGCGTKLVWEVEK